MRILGLCALVMSAAIAAPAFCAQPLPAASSPESVGFSSERLKRLDGAMNAWIADGKVAGATTMLVRHGKVVSFNTYGHADVAAGRPMHKDAIFRIYSMSKPITGVAMMILFEQGKWQLDDPVSMYVPQFKNLRVLTGEFDSTGRPITEPMTREPTMRELMSHTAGFAYGLNASTPSDRMFREKGVLTSQGLQAMIDKVAETPLIYQPGTDWYYSIAVDVQGYIVEKLSGQSLGAFLQQNIFAPLKMTDTAFTVAPGATSRLASVYVLDPATGRITPAPGQRDFTKPPTMESGGGGLTSTTTDYARFTQMVINGGELEGARILSPATIELMGTNQIPASARVKSNGVSSTSFDENTGFGLDFAILENPRAAGRLEGKGTLSWGGAAGTWFWIDPTNDVVFIGMIQRMGGGGGDDMRARSRVLVYQALVDPKK